MKTGDALRIKLPFTDSNTEYPEFLWIENHQGIAENGNPFDKWNYEPDLCIGPIVPGLQMYVQIDKEIKEDSFSATPIYAGPGDHIRPLDANGHYDLSYDLQSPLNNCVSWNNTYPATIQGKPNPFTGSADRHWVSDDYNATGTLTHGDVRLNTTFRVGSNPPYTYLDNLFHNGHTRQVFTPGGNNKVGVSTNPSSATMMNLVGYDQTTTNGVKNLRRIYLNGVSVELLAQNPDGSIKVKVRFDDVDVKNNARWCADEIQLNPVATTTGYSLNVTNGYTVTLDRGTTATRRDNPETWNGQQVFNSATLMRCPASTWLNLAPGGGFTVDNGSTLRLESGSRMDVGNGSVLRVKRGGTLELMGGSVLNVLPGGQVIIEEDAVNGNDGHLKFHPNARINMEAASSVLEIAGMLDIQPNATFRPCRSGDINSTYGLVKFTNTDNPSMNVTAGTNTRFVLRSTGTANRILHVEQESLYGPSTLVEFTLYKAKATLAPYARIVPPVTNTAAINFVNAVVTSSTGLRINHRGVRLNGQSQAYFSSSTFSKGTYGVYSYNTTLGNDFLPENCDFIDCRIGLYNYDKGITAVECKFDKCDNGLVCHQQSHTSYLMDCSARYNKGTGVTFEGSATLNVRNAGFDSNSVGVSLNGATAVVGCGTVSLNKRYGFGLFNGATLRMDDPGSGHDPVTAIKNATTVYCELANNVHLDYGYNSLKSYNPGTQNVLRGTFICQPYANPQPARKNNWNGTSGIPLTNADYIITSCGGSIQFQDPVSAPEVSCGQTPMFAPGGGAVASLFAACPECGTVETAGGVVLPLNAAIQNALATAGNDSLANNERIALQAFYTILSNAMPTPNDQEGYLLGRSYDFLKECFSDGLGKGQLSPAADTEALDLYTGLVTGIQDARLAGAAPVAQEDFIFYTTMEKAQTLRAAGHLGEAISLINTIPDPSGEQQQAYRAEILCFTQTELALLNGTIGWDDVEGTLENCGGQGAPKMMAALPDEVSTRAGSMKPYVFPNPATTSIQIGDCPGQGCTLRVMDRTGRSVLKDLRFNHSTEVSVTDLSPGLYLWRMESEGGGAWTGKLAISR